VIDWSHPEIIGAITGASMGIGAVGIGWIVRLYVDVKVLKNGNGRCRNHCGEHQQLVDMASGALESVQRLEQVHEREETVERIVEAIRRAKKTGDFPLE
jgi:hypothetical protein